MVRKQSLLSVLILILSIPIITGFTSPYLKGFIHDNQANSEGFKYICFNTNNRTYSINLTHDAMSFNCKIVNNSDTLIRIVCDSRNDGNGDGSCQSGESCIGYSFYSDNYTVISKNGGFTFDLTGGWGSAVNQSGYVRYSYHGDPNTFVFQNTELHLLNVNQTDGNSCPAPNIISPRASNYSIADQTMLVSFTTDFEASCKYSNASGTAFDNMILSTTTGNISHNFAVPVSDNTNYTYFFKCNNSLGNVNPSDNSLTFFVEVSKPLIIFNDTSALNLTSNNLFLMSNFSDTGSGFEANATCEFCAAADGVCDTEWISTAVATNVVNGSRGNCSYFWNTSSITDSFYNISMRITDIGNNTGTTSRRILLRRDPPDISISFPPNNHTAKSNTSAPNTTLNFDYQITEVLYPVNCSIVVNDKINQTKVSSVSSNRFSIVLGFLAAGSYYYNWSIACTNPLGFSNSTQTRNLTLNVVALPGGGGGGGGGGGIAPVSFAGGTAGNATHHSRNWIFINVSLGITPSNITFILESGGNVVTQNSLSNVSLRSTNFTILNDELYTYSVNVTDTNGSLYTSPARIIILDTLAPGIVFAGGTSNGTLTSTQNWIFINLSIQDSNFNNSTYRLYRDGTLLNETTINSVFLNFTLGDSGEYLVNVTARDKAGNQNSTSTIKVISKKVISPIPTIINSKYLVQKSTNHLEFNESITELQSVVTKTNLGSLKDGKLTNEYGDHTYTNSIYLPSKGRMQFTSNPDENGQPAKTYFSITKSQRVFKYLIQFSPALKTDHNTDLNRLEDIEGKTLRIGEKDFTILRASHPARGNVTLKLVNSAISDTLEEGAAKTYTINGKDYDVTLDFVGSSTAKFTVNDETTTSLSEGDIFKFKDDTEISIVDILAQQFGGGVRKVQFTLGTGSITIVDNNTWVDNNSSVTVSSSYMKHLTADIMTGSDSGIEHGADVTITSIEFEYTALEDLYIPEQTKISTITDDIDQQQGTTITGTIDFAFDGLQIPSTESIRLHSSSSSNYKLEWTNKAGITYDTEIFARNASGSIRLGRFSGSTMYNIVTKELDPVVDEEYVIVSKNDYSRILQFKDVNPTDNTVKIRDTGSGALYDVLYSESLLNGTLSLDNNSYQIKLSTDANSANIFVDMNGDSDFDDEHNPELWTEKGLRITLQAWAGANNSGTSHENQINFTTEEREETISPRADTWIINITENQDGEIDLADNLTYSESGRYMPQRLIKKNTSSDIYQGYTGYGAFLEMDAISSEPDTQNIFTVTYPDTQIFGLFNVVTTIADPLIPRIITTIPANNSIGAPINTNITLIFSEAIDTDTLKHKYFTLVNNLRASFPISISYNDLLNQTIITPQIFLAFGETYTVLVSSNLKDLTGNNLTATNFSFTTPPNPFNKSAPIIGNLSLINSNIPKINITINGTGYNNVKKDWQPISVGNGSRKFMEMNFPFGNMSLDFSNLTFKQTTNSSAGSFVIRGIPYFPGANKTMYVQILANAYGICIKDANIADVDEISSNCKGENETYLKCPGTFKQYGCELDGSWYKITGLAHSGVQEQGDTGAPLIIELSTSNSGSTVTISVTTDENATCKFDESDTAFASLSYSMTDSVTSHTGSRTYSSTSSGTYYVRCNDTTGNVMSYSNTTSFSVSIKGTPSTGGGGGGSSGGSGGGGGGGGAGGGSAAGSATKSERFYDVVQANTPIEVKVKNDELAVVSLEFETNVKSEKVNIAVDKINDSKVTVKLDNVLQYLNVSTINLDDRIKSAAIEFKVSKRWLTERNINSKDVVMKRFNNNAWNSLQTSVISESEVDYTYEAITPGFSIFAITAEKSVIKNTPREQNVKPSDLTIASAEVAREVVSNQTSSKEEVKTESITGAAITEIKETDQYSLDNRIIIVMISVGALGVIAAYLYNIRKK